MLQAWVVAPILGMHAAEWAVRVSTGRQGCTQQAGSGLTRPQRSRMLLMRALDGSTAYRGECATPAT